MVEKEEAQEQSVGLCYASLMVKAGLIYGLFASLLSFDFR